MAQPLFVRKGKVTLDWDNAGNLRITREDDMSGVLLSHTEWEWLLRCAELYGWPTAPPFVPAQAVTP